MGLFAIKIRDGIPATEVTAILAERGYSVSFERETSGGLFFSVPGKRRPLAFWITSKTPHCFCVGLGPEGKRLVKVLADRAVFAEPQSGAG
jgi:hypothetical protein